MKRIAAILFAIAASLSFPLHAQNRDAKAVNPDDPAVKAATEQAGQAALRWLASLDANNFEACWNGLAPAVKGQVAKADFDGSLSAVREQYGSVRTRHPSKVTFTHAMPGAPDGDYVVLQYDTEFSKGARAVETVIPMRTADGWKVSGYFVR